MIWRGVGLAVTILLVATLLSLLLPGLFEPIFSWMKELFQDIISPVIPDNQ